MSLKPTRPTTRRSTMPGPGANTVVSCCSRCGQTVWNWQAHEWSTQRWALGIVHTDCEEAP